jgi:regulator of replication initiation timing
MNTARQAAERILDIPCTELLASRAGRVNAISAVIQEAIDAATAELKAENERLRQRLLTAAGDDLCRLSQAEIAAFSLGVVKIPPEEEFLASCKRFHEQMMNEVGVMSDCLTLAQLIAENEKLRTECNEAREAAWLRQSE